LKELFKFNLNNFKEINAAMLCLLHATQYIAVAGKHLIEQEPDDSNTNFLWSEPAKSFIGRKITKGQVARIGINALDLEIQIMNSEGKVLSYFPLHEQTKADGFNFMKNALGKMGVDVRSLSMEMHYKIQETGNINDKFIKPDKLILKELTYYRTNANRIIEYFAEKFKLASEVRIWPHHFDTGSYIPIEIGANNEVLKSIGIGFAIADSNIKQPYFYINHWADKGKLDYTNLPLLEGNGSWNTKNWTGAVLSVKNILKEPTIEGQAKMVSDFFISGINATLQLFNDNKVFAEFKL